MDEAELKRLNEEYDRLKKSLVAANTPRARVFIEDMIEETLNHIIRLETYLMSKVRFG